ncbi:signal recognition particle subunit [Tieghemiomyces parasiticus]|uniref:Signal recognition particle subunit n=1 Tax=Tieghemiomyces parasiticus TaxID=78921 RepID=A0A9W7ZYH9_9FUNG|nr:signal recognition particle subunit [Tieghemiomyces parasiticus]
MSHQGKGKAPAVTIEDGSDDDIDNMDFPLPMVPASAFPGAPERNIRYVEDSSQFKSWICLYPIYFDRNRSVQDGRRVGKDLAVDRPRAQHLAEAVSDLHLQLLFEPEKIHPRDFLNPGRVKVQLKNPDGSPALASIPNRNTLYQRVAKLLPETMQSVTLDEPDFTEEEIRKQLKQLMEEPPAPKPTPAPTMRSNAAPRALESSTPATPSKKAAKAEKGGKKGKKNARLV